jgi:hypothetical protein
MERKGKLLLKNEEISVGKAHINPWKLNWDISMITDIFLDQKRVSLLIRSEGVSLLIEKDICDHQNISIKFPCVYVCLSLFWSRKTSVNVDMSQLSSCLFVCAFPPEISSFCGKSFAFLSHFLRYLYSGTFVSMWSLMLI